MKRMISSGCESEESNGPVRKKGRDQMIVKGAWGTEEDQLLINAVNNHGTDWKTVALHIPGRTSKQCRDRYKLKLDPDINHGPWTPEEDEKLQTYQKLYGRQWTRIAKFLPGRTENSVKSRFASLLRSKSKLWNDEEDAILQRCRESGMEFQEIVDNYLPNRSTHAVQKRWERLFMRELASRIRSRNASASESYDSPSYPVDSVDSNFDNDNDDEVVSGLVEMIVPEPIVHHEEPSHCHDSDPLIDGDLECKFASNDELPDGVRRSMRSGNLRKQTTSVRILRSIIKEPL